DLAASGFGLCVLLIVILYAGELIWREREARLDQIMDALPVPGWLYFTSKFGALMLVGFDVHLIGMACGIGIQVSKGYYTFELPLYAIDLLGIKMVGYFQFAALALVVQTLVNHKHLGHFVMVLYLILASALPRFGFAHHLYRYGSDPGYTYSDMNGFGPFLGPWGWFNLYWTLDAVLLALLTHLFWVRGQETRFRHRLALAAGRLSRPVRLGLGTVGLAFGAVGGFIFYNPNVLNQYKTENDVKRQAVPYERLYKPLERAPQPRITDIEVKF